MPHPRHTDQTRSVADDRAARPRYDCRRRHRLPRIRRIFPCMCLAVSSHLLTLACSAYRSCFSPFMLSHPRISRYTGTCTNALAETVLQPAAVALTRICRDFADRNAYCWRCKLKLATYDMLLGLFFVPDAKLAVAVVRFGNMSAAFQPARHPLSSSSYVGLEAYRLVYEPLLVGAPR